MTREKLLPQELLEQIPPLYFNEGTPADETIIRAKYFIDIFTWLAAECETRGDDVLFYGYVVNAAEPHLSEWGYFTLKQLMEIRLRGGIGVERDLSFKKCAFGEYMKREGAAYG